MNASKEWDEYHDNCLKTVSGLASELRGVADRIDQSASEDLITPLLMIEAADRLENMQKSLVAEVARIEKLQPLANAVLAATKTYTS